MQKTSLYKRIVTMLLAFVMVLGAFPASQFVVPANAASSEGSPPATITMKRWKIYQRYDSVNMIPARTTPRTFVFNVNGQESPGFCADHGKDINLVEGEEWNTPIPIEEAYTPNGTPYSIAIPLIAAYNNQWTLSKEIDRDYPNLSIDQKRQKLLELTDGFVYYIYDPYETASRLFGSSATTSSPI